MTRGALFTVTIYDDLTIEVVGIPAQGVSVNDATAITLRALAESLTAGRMSLDGPPPWWRAAPGNGDEE